jgi:hypothetical protein
MGIAGRTRHFLNNVMRLLLSPNVLPVVILFTTTVAVLSPILIFHKATFFVNLDNVDQFYSWYQKLSNSIHSGYIPLWNNNTFGGQSFVGEIQQGVFYPLNLIFVWLFGTSNGISHWALEYLMAFHFFLASLGMYLVLKTMKVSRVSAILSGVTYAFSGVVAVRAASQSAIFFGLCLLPYPVFSLLKYHVNRKIRWLIASGVTLGLIILSGHIQPFFHAFLIISTLEAVRIKRDKSGPIFVLKKSALNIIKRFAIIGGATVVVALPQLWLSYQYLPNVYRIQAEGYVSSKTQIQYGGFAKSFNVDPHEVANFVEPGRYPVRDGNNVYIGLLPFVIIILAATFAREHIKKSILWSKYSRFITGLGIFSVLTMLGYWTWFAVVLYKLPLVHQVRQLGRYSIILHFITIAVFAISFDVMSRIKVTKKQAARLGVVGAFLLVNSIYLFLLRKHIFSLHFALHNFLLSCGLFAIAFVKYIRIRKVILTALVVASAVVNGLWFMPKPRDGVRVTSDYFLEQDLVRVLEQTHGTYRIEVEDNALPINIANAYSFETIGGYGATIYSPYFEFYFKDIEIDKNLKRDLMGVTYIVTPYKSAEGSLAYANDDKKVFVKQRFTALSKLFVTSNEGSLSRKDYQSLPVRTEVYKDMYQKYTLTLDKGETVIISELQYPGWGLTIDGKNIEWKPYSLAGIPVFRSFYVPAGSHVIEFRYKPFGI